MKKTYKNPELEVIKIQTQQMLAASDVEVPIDNTLVGSGTPGDAREDGFTFDDAFDFGAEESISNFE